MKQRKPYKTFTKEFKQEAVRLMETEDRPASEIAVELGIRRNQLYKWKAQLSVKGDEAFSGNPGRPKKESQSELKSLKQENERLKEEVEILKKAAVGSGQVTYPEPRALAWRHTMRFNGQPGIEPAIEQETEGDPDGNRNQGSALGL